MTAKYRKKPIVIEAEQWFPDKDIEGVLVFIPGHEKIILDKEGNLQKRIPEDKTVTGIVSAQYFIQTLEGRMYLSPGDWVITGVNGEKYPCKPDIFEKTYEKLDDWWQPIESAPKGKRVLLNRSSKQKEICIGSLEYEEYGGELSWKHECGGQIFPKPTHWMPLPNPPNVGMVKIKTE